MWLNKIIESRSTGQAFSAIFKMLLGMAILHIGVPGFDCQLQFQFPAEALGGGGTGFNT